LLKAALSLKDFEVELYAWALFCKRIY
jgi:hypothetical protein